MDALRTLLTIARTALDGAEAMIPPEPAAHPDSAPPKPARKLKRKQSKKTAPVAKDKKHRYICDDCQHAFTSAASLMDAKCPACGGLHISKRTNSTH